MRHASLNADTAEGRKLIPSNIQRIKNEFVRIAEDNVFPFVIKTHFHCIIIQHILVVVVDHRL